MLVFDIALLIITDFLVVGLLYYFAEAGNQGDFCTCKVTSILRTTSLAPAITF